MNTCETCGKTYKKSHKCAGATFLFVPVERKESRKGRKPAEKPGMDLLISNWANFPVGVTIALPDASGTDDHAKVTLDRHHFKVRAGRIGLIPGQDYTIEAHPDFGATITRKR